MTVTVEDLQEFLQDEVSLTFTDSKLQKALVQAKDYLIKRGITASGPTGDRITTLQAALFVTTGQMYAVSGESAGTSGTTGTVIEGGQITEIRDGDAVIKYSATSVQGATSGTAGSAGTIDKTFRIYWQHQLDELVLLSDDCAETYSDGDP